MSSHPPRTGGPIEPTILALAALVIVVLDQLSKAAVAASVAIGERVSVVGQFVELWHAQNRGAAFSLFQGGTLFFLAVTVLAIGMIGYFYRVFRGGSPWLHAVLGVILGGTLGNLIDRVRFGYVTDFVSVGVGDLRWPTFNVADASLFLGIGVMVIYLLLTDPARREASA
jgi:signal peptidase II